MDIYIVLTGVNIILAIVGTIMMLKLSKKIPGARYVFRMVACFTTAAAFFYSYLLIESPDIGMLTAVLGRGLLTLLLGAIIMLATVMEK